MAIIQKSNGLYILEREDIERIATVKLKEYSPSNLEAPKPFDTTGFLEEHLGLVVKSKYVFGFNSGILGLTVMGDIVQIPSCDEWFRPVVLEETFGTVLITPHLMGRENLARRRYTEMHEAAHFILHRPYFERAMAAEIKQRADDGAYVACRTVEMCRGSKRTDEDWLEYQADALAAALLMPRQVFYHCVRDIMRNRGITNAYIAPPPYVSRSKIRDIIAEVAELFQVSYRATYIRMHHLGLISKVRASI